MKLLTTGESTRRFESSKMHQSTPVAMAAVRSKAVILLSLTHCLLLLQKCDSWCLTQLFCAVFGKVVILCM